ncbi:MAG: CocE/NonD family hydrolase [Pseudomonadota bacterium]
MCYSLRQGSLLAALIIIVTLTMWAPAEARKAVPRDIAQGEVADAEVLFGDRWKGYAAEQHMVSMRDGVRLNTFLLYPKVMSEALPIMYLRTPYGWRLETLDGEIAGDINRDAAAHRFLIEDQYIFVLQDERGLFGSEGEHELMRPFYSLADATRTDEITDIYDTIEWSLSAAKNNNGRVGMSGTSYRGWYAAVGAIRPHPALKAIAPSAAMGDFFRGDDFYQNGAFNLSMTMPLLLEKMDFYDEKPVWSDFVKAEDEYDFYLRHGGMRALKQYFPEDAQQTLNVLENDAETEYWKARRLPTFFDRTVTVPTLHIVSGYDAEDLPGPLALYHAMERHDENNLNRIVMGPWYHGAWRYGAEKFGPISFGSDTGVYFQNEFFLPFFRKHLKGEGLASTPEAHMFDTGANAWRSFEAWPPKASQTIKLYLQPAERLSFDGPSGDRNAKVRYTYDPANPTPYFPRPNYEAFRADFKVQDQRFSMRRPDVLTFATEPLDRDITIAGEAFANLTAATSGTDTDWVVKVIDVYPDDAEGMEGFHRMVFGGIFRAKFREGLDAPRAVKRNTPLDYRFSLTEQLHTVKKGHRLMVHVQSSWFPLFDRNPNTFMPVHDARPEDYAPATQTIFLSERRPSFVELTILAQD